MDQLTKLELSDGATLLNYRTQRFKLSMLTIAFALKLEREDVCALAAIPGLLRYTSARYPTNMEMERKLASLYGTGFSASSLKMGDTQVLLFKLTHIADKFAFGGEALGEACLSFLCDTVFHPDLDDNGCFKEENLKREKRLMREAIQNEMNDKMLYAAQQFNAAFYENEPAAITAGGTLEGVEALTGKAVTRAWKKMLQSAKVFICHVGEGDTQQLEKTLEQHFCAVERAYHTVDSLPHSPAQTLKTKEQVQALEQCKLNIGFSAPSEDEAAMKVFSMIFGGSELSRLSKIVREKMSLCYYCYSAYSPLKKTLCVYSGIEGAQQQKATDAICAQLHDLQQGNITEEEIRRAKTKLKDSALSSFDSPADITIWYLSKMYDTELKNNEQVIEEIENVSTERIIACAKTVKIDTIYTLK